MAGVRTFDALVRDTIAHGVAHSPEIRARLDTAGIDPGQVHTVADLAGIPVLAKDSVPEMQEADPPFGGMLAVSVGDLVRIYTSPGPILDPEGPGEDFWRFRPALEAAGFGPGQIVLNTFSYHLTPGGMMLDAGLRAAGCVVIPGGVGNTAAQVELARSAGVTGYVGTPQFLVALLEKAVELETPLPLARAAVTGAPFPPSLRQAVTEYGVEAFECYGTADAGTLGFECSQHDGWHVAPGVVIEIADPTTGKPLPPGETGEVLVTSPNPVYPLLRFGTGDLSAWVDEGCACGRESPRLRGFLGRSGEGIKVKGMFVHPRQIAAALAPFDEVDRWQAVVTAEGHRDLLTVRVECAGPVQADALQDALRTQVKVGLEVDFVPPDTLPAEGRRVVDAREG